MIKRSIKYLIAGLLGILQCMVCRYFHTSEFMAGASTMIVYFNAVELLKRLNAQSVHEKENHL